MKNRSLPLTEQNTKKVTRKVSRHSTFKTIPLNYEEFRLHTWNGSMVARCLAKSRRTGVQCGAFAVTGYATCYHHGASKKSGKRTAAGEQNRYDSIFKHGDRSAPVIKRRSDASKELYLLRQAAYAIDMIPWWGSGKKKPKLHAVNLALKVVKK